MNMEAFILGTGGMMPLPGRSLTSMLLRREGELLLFDCGEGTQISLRRLALRWKKISVIFISHTHADHVTGLPGILMLSSQVERDDPLTIVGPPRIREYVEASRRILDMYINYEIVVNEVWGEGVVYERPGYRVRSLRLNHTKPCLAYALEEEDRAGVFMPERALELGVPRGPLWSTLQSGTPVRADSGEVRPEQVMGLPRPGRKVCYMTDTAFVSGAASFVQGSDLLICEGMFGDDLSGDAVDKKHLTARQAAQIARDGAVRRLGLIHYSPRYTDRELKELLQEARAVFPDTFLTRDLQVIEVPYVEG
ncbi:MAG: ribonuclease Z [Spirochaetales bacterium]|nr:ribonuclease Z [Spirochaetales bacterium]